MCQYAEAVAVILLALQQGRACAFHGHPEHCILLKKLNQLLNASFKPPKVGTLQDDTAQGRCIKSKSNWLLLVAKPGKLSCSTPDPWP